jgi:hypothetical protein
MLPPFPKWWTQHVLPLPCGPSEGHVPSATLTLAFKSKLVQASLGGDPDLTRVGQRALKAQTVVIQAEVLACTAGSTQRI